MILSYIKSKISLKYVISTTTTITLVFAGLFLWISHKNSQLIMDQVKKQAAILHNQIVLTRHWVADQKEILVLKNKQQISEGKRSNDSSIIDRDYTRITPAVLTRQLSNYAMKNNQYSFELNSIQEVNILSRLDRLSDNSIKQLISGEKKWADRIFIKDGKYTYKYTAPIFMTKSCISSHNKKTYSPGDISGFISVLMPFDQERAAIRNNRLFLLVGLTCLTVIVILILVFFERILVFKPVKTIKEFTEQIKQKEFNQEIELTGDEFEEFESICMLIDEKLKNQHQKLENKINEATRDLAQTNQKLAQANKELLAFNKAKIDFFSDISHEFRTPLTSVKGAADILIRKNLCQDNSYVEIIKKNTERLIRTTVDLIDYSKIEADRLELDKQKESLNTVAMQVIETQKTIAQQKRINLVLDSPDDFVLMFDEHRIFQVITNLVANAIRFSPAKGTITISINSTINSNGSEVAVSVQDQGPGILEEYRKSIFNKFYQIPQPGDKSNKNIGSSGIGLAICKGLVKAHGGKIWVEGAEKQGSRFIFTLPA